MIWVYALVIIAFTLTLATGFALGLLAGQALTHRFVEDIEHEKDLLNISLKDTIEANEKFMESYFTYNEFQNGLNSKNK
ncbi:MAG: hypothetical protein AAF927_01780 [Bacteroidota bacterium]